MTYNLKLNLTGKTPTCQVATIKLKNNPDFSKIDISLVNQIQSYKLTPCANFKGDITFATTVSDKQIMDYAQQYPILINWAKQLNLALPIISVEPTPVIIKPTEPKPEVVVVKPEPVKETQTDKLPVIKPQPKQEVVKPEVKKTQTVVADKPQQPIMTVRSGGIESLLFPIVLAVLLIGGVILTITRGK